MEEALNKRKILASLTDDVVLEILCHLPVRSLFCYKCVYRSWKNLISDPNNQRKLPQTVASFLYDGHNYNQNFTSIVRGVHLHPRSWKFLPFNIKDVAVSDCCNGLILCWCHGADGYNYVVCNPMTEYIKILPPSTHDIGHAAGEARLAFDPTASKQYHMIEYVDVDSVCAGVEICSSTTEAWIYKESQWGEGTDLTMFRQPSVFLNGCLHIMGLSRQYDMIHSVDMSGNTWRKIDRSGGRKHSMHQAQSHLCVCTVDGLNESKLSIWTLEDYGTNNWTLKHIVTMDILFGSTDIGVAWPEIYEEDIVITVHPEWNLIFFAREGGTIIAYNMDRREVHDVPFHVFRYGIRTIKDKFNCRPFYLSYVPLFLDFSSRA